jgi:hypothetical protein
MSRASCRRRRDPPGLPAARSEKRNAGLATGQLRTRWPKLGACMDEAETIAYTGFPTQHRTKLHSTNPLERQGGRRRRNLDSIIRLVGAVLMEQNDEWQLQHRYMQIEGPTQPTHDSTHHRKLTMAHGHSRNYNLDGRDQKNRAF